MKDNTKKSILIISTIVLIALTAVVCAISNYNVDKKTKEYLTMVGNLEMSVKELEQQKLELTSEISDFKKDNGLEKYQIVLQIKQKHFSLDITKHIKDKINVIDLPIIVDKEYYDKFNVGDEVLDDFRVGSLICKGSFGSNVITVKSKQII